LGQEAAEGEPIVCSIPASKTASRNQYGYRNLAFSTAHLSRVAQEISSKMILGAPGLHFSGNALESAWRQPTSGSGSGFCTLSVQTDRSGKRWHRSLE
jgi:hypothetical protein